jgi:hypothetical protein
MNGHIDYLSNVGRDHPHLPIRMFGQVYFRMIGGGRPNPVGTYARTIVDVSGEVLQRSFGCFIGRH